MCRFAGPLWRYIQLELLGVDTGVRASTEGDPADHTEPRLLVSSRLRVSTYCAPITPQKKPVFVPGQSLGAAAGEIRQMRSVFTS